MPRIFISYRRDDSGGYAGRLYDRLRERFGEDQIFMDIDTLQPGLDFVEAINRAVGSCDVLVAVIGRQWSAISDSTGQRRLENPEDFVRLEISIALDRDIRVIPALVRGAAMPRSTDLPAPLKRLSRRQALEISDTRFHTDADRLIEAIEGISAGEAAERPGPHGEIDEDEKASAPAPAAPGLPMRAYAPTVPSTPPATATPASAFAPHDYAGIGQRFAAYLIDSLILMIALVLTSAFVVALEGESGASSICASVLWYAGQLGYYTYFGVRSGQTPGKRAMRIKVVCTDGSLMSTGKSAVRAFGYWISALCLYVGFLWALWDQDRQTWHDKMAGTHVVKV